MNYKTTLISALLAGSMHQALAMQQQSWGSPQRLPALVARVQSFSPLAHNPHQYGPQVPVVEHNGGNQMIPLAEVEQMMDVALNHQMQQHQHIEGMFNHQMEQQRQWDQTMTDVNEILTQQAVEIGKLKAKIAALEQKRD